MSHRKFFNVCNAPRAAGSSFDTRFLYPVFVSHFVSPLVVLLFLKRDLKASEPRFSRTLQRLAYRRFWTYTARTVVHRFERPRGIKVLLQPAIELKFTEMDESTLIQKFIDFHRKAAKLKGTTRHSWLSDTSSRQESVAEHSWMLCVLAILMADELQEKVDLLKVLKMVVIHDLAESVTGDIPSHEISDRQNTKKEAEKAAFNDLVKDLPRKGEEILSLWKEFERNETPEAQFANALDKVEALLQHNIASIETWAQGDFNVGPYYKDHYFNFDKFIRAFKDVVDIQTMEKIIDSSNENRIEKKHLEKYNSRPTGFEKRRTEKPLKPSTN